MSARFRNLRRPRHQPVARLHNAVLNLDDNAPGLKVALRFKPAA